MLRRFAAFAALWPTLLLAQPAASARMEGVVYDSLFAKAPLAGATVVVRELQRYVTTDSAGHFRVDSLVPGRYTLDVLHEMLDSLDLRLPGHVVDLSRGPRTTVSLGVPDARALHRLLCGTVAVARSGLVLGTVRTLNGVQPIDSAQVDVQWKEAVFDRTGVREETRAASVRTDASGAFVLCSVPFDTDLRIRTTAAALTPSVMESRADSAGLRRLEIRLGDGGGAIRFAVAARDGAPLADAMVRIEGISALRTDSAGTAVATLSAGSHSAEVIAMGYAPRLISFVVRPDGGAAVPIVMTRTVSTLEPVKVFGRFEMLNRRLDEFEARRRVGLGAYVGPRDLAKVSGTELVDAMRASRGIRVEIGAPGLMWPLLRGGGATCIPNFFVNGVHFPVDGPRASPSVRYPYTDLVGALPLESVIAIEIYAGIGSIPPQYDRTSTNSCGSILFWTK